MAVSFSLLLTALLGAEPASSAAKPKVYVVYVTVVEVDADGDETVLFTPKVQTTGEPAGATVEHVDGRSFEFQCKLAAATIPALERPPVEAVAAKPPAPVGLIKPGPKAEVVPSAKPGAPSNPPVSRKVDEFFVRTYDISDLLDTADNITEANFIPLIQTVKTVAAPESWAGKATIRPFVSTKSLVIKQNDAGHKAVAAALQELRPRKLSEGANSELRSP